MTIDLTGIATTLIAGVFSVLAVVIPMLINARMKDTAAAAALSSAVKNSLGALEQASAGAVVSAKPVVTIPGVSAALAPGVQYVLDHAGDEAARFGLTPEAIADKVSAQIGLAKIAAGTAVTLPPPTPSSSAAVVPIPVKVVGAPA
jgi:hypothetical protein